MSGETAVSGWSAARYGFLAAFNRSLSADEGNAIEKALSKPSCFADTAT